MCYNGLSWIDYIPPDFAKIYYEVSKDLYRIGCSYVGDISKRDHWFYVEDSSGFIQLKIIDFDAVSISEQKRDDVIDHRTLALKREFNFLFDKDDINAYDFNLDKTTVMQVQSVNKLGLHFYAKIPSRNKLE